MYKKVSILICLLSCFLVSLAQVSEQWLLYYLGGQSNMDGYGFNTDLPDSLNAAFEDVWIFDGNRARDHQMTGGQGEWGKLMPGHGVGFKFENGNQLSDRFGVELSFAFMLKKAFPEKKIAIIKYSRGGSSIDSLAAGKYGSWDPDFEGINQYDHFLETIKNSYKSSDIDGDGVTDELIPKGIIWMQGESDASYTESIALEYYQNLKTLIKLINASLRVKNIPVVIGKISDSGKDVDGKVRTYGEIVQYAQEKYARLFPNASIVRDTHSFEYLDRSHYLSKDYIELGYRFAQEVLILDSDLKRNNAVIE